MAEPTFAFYDVRLKELVDLGDLQATEFFRCLALCHTVMPDEKNGQLIYQAQSPDEGALVSAARNFGFVFRVSLVTKARSCRRPGSSALSSG